MLTASFLPMQAYNRDPNMSVTRDTSTADADKFIEYAMQSRRKSDVWPISIIALGVLLTVAWAGVLFWVAICIVIG
jgi:hypothetical protein